MAVRRHFVPGLRKNPGELAFVGLTREIAQVVLKEDRADDVFERLCLGIAAQPLLAHKRANAGSLVRFIACRGHDLAEAAGVKFLEIVAPFQIARATRWIAVPRRRPALDVLPAR